MYNNMFNFFIKQTGNVFFFSGCIGLILFWLEDSFYSTLIFYKIVMFILFIPAIIGFAISNIVLFPICFVNPHNICRGLGLDGGPLEFIEWAGMFGGMFVGYGVYGLGLYLLYKKIRKS